MIRTMILTAGLTSALAMSLYSLERWEDRQQATQPAPVDLTMYGETQYGCVLTLGSPDDEDAWFDAAQQAADRRGEAIAVTQDGKLVALLNPRR